MILLFLVLFVSFTESTLFVARILSTASYTVCHDNRRAIVSPRGFVDPVLERWLGADGLGTRRSNA